jgi:predicted ATPase with chaperone activity
MGVTLFGKAVAKRALEIALVGDLNIALVGPRGVGKRTTLTAFAELSPKARAVDTCACGNHGAIRRACTCPPRMLYRWLRRFDLRIASTAEILVEVPEPTHKDMAAPPQDSPEWLAEAAERICRAKFFGLENYTLELSDDAARRTMELAARKLGFSPWRYEAVLRVARAVANLGASPTLQARHVAEAAQYADLYYMRPESLEASK